MKFSKSQIEVIESSLEIWSDEEFEELYSDMLRDCYDRVNIAGYDYDVADALRSIDPTAYQVGMADYISNLLEDYTEIESGRYVRTDELEALIESLTNESA
jgi:uncharacterized protein YutD